MLKGDRFDTGMIEKHSNLIKDLETGGPAEEVEETATEQDGGYLIEYPQTSEGTLEITQVNPAEGDIQDITHETEDDNSLSLEKKEKELIIKALQKNNNKRKYAARDLGISERTLYRKIKQYEIGNK